VRPTVSKSDPQVVAILCADIHFSHAPPLMRSGELDWYFSMKDAWHEVKQLCHQHKAPVIIAGDITHKWNEPAQLISFIIRLFSNIDVYACVGNHDLPNHSHEEIQRSALWTVFEAGKIKLLDKEPLEIGGLRLRGFPWGHSVSPLINRHSLLLELAICHEFIWTKETGYPGAPESGRLKAFRERVKGYDIALVGDNHQNIFSPSDTECTILNPGTFMRRRADDLPHNPCVGLLHSDGTVKLHYLDTSKDIYLNKDEMEKAKKEKADFSDFVDGLTSLGDSEFDFPTAVKHFLDKNDISKDTKKQVIRMLEK
jgi:Calcineurin-like phosphoesterase